MALQIILYYDELEICNPLGSRRKKAQTRYTCYVMYVCLRLVVYIFVAHIFSFRSTCNFAHMTYALGAFYFLLGNLHPRLRSKISTSQLLLLAKSSMVAEFGIDHMLQPVVKDIQKLESVCEV